jgi:hypothetical protein
MSATEKQPMQQPSRARAPKKHVILFLAANPHDTGRLALDREAHSIHLELKRCGYRERFEFVTRWAVEPLDLLRELRELKPTVVHFSGHGAPPAATMAPVQGRDVVVTEALLGSEPSGVVVNGANGRSQVVTPEAIAQTLDAVGAQVRLVVLKACYSASIADALLAHVDCVVGMSDAIHDDAARSFAIGFYGGLGEHESIAAAFKQGIAAIQLDGLPDADRPQLRVRSGFDATQPGIPSFPPDVLVDVPCPYPGMRPYNADDAGGFHGRDTEIAELIGRLRAGEREIFVIGPSGSGKSSLVTAGILPRLARGVTGLGMFVVRELRPGEQPAARLGQALEIPAGEGLAVANRVAALLAHRAPSVSLLLVVDQLEELFTLANASERARFLDALQALRVERRCAVVYMLRADFFGALMESPLWAERRGQLSRVEVSPLRDEALREAIALPARAVGVTVEPELIERLVADAASEPGIGTDFALKRKRLDPGSEAGPMAVVVAPRDRSRDTTKGEGEYVVLLHKGLPHGAEIVIESPRLRDLRVTRAERNQLRWLDPEPITDDTHRDPVPGFEGRWLAGFAPVGDTGFVVIVQTRYDAALKPNTRLSRRLAWRGSAVILVWLAACGTFLWGSVRRRRSPAIGTAPRRPL